VKTVTDKALSASSQDAGNLGGGGRLITEGEDTLLQYSKKERGFNGRLRTKEAGPVLKWEGRLSYRKKGTI